MKAYATETNRMHLRMKEIALLLATTFLAFAQTDDLTLPASSATTRENRTLPIQRIGPDDLLSVSVADCPELTRNFRVLGDGTLALPLLKQRIPASNRLPQELEAAIAERHRYFDLEVIRVARSVFHEAT